MGIDTGNLVFYAAESADGGAIDLSSPQTSAVLGEEFSKVSIAERSTGTVRYAKQFILNSNGEDWTNVKVYLSSLTSLSPNTGAAFALTGSKSRLETASLLSGTATLTATGWVETSVDLREEVATGEQIFNGSDLLSNAVRIADMSSTWIRLDGPYTGTVGDAVELMVAPALTAQFISPTSADASSSPTTHICAGRTRGIWKQYQVWETCPAFSNDTFAVTFEGT